MDPLTLLLIVPFSLPFWMALFGRGDRDSGSLPPPPPASPLYPARPPEQLELPGMQQMLEVSDEDVLALLEVPESEEEYLGYVEEIQERLWPAMKRLGAVTPLVPDIVAMYFSMLDPETPWEVKFQVSAALLYVVIPGDLIPEILLGPMGYADDSVIVMWALQLISGHVEPEHTAAAQRWLASQGGSDRPVE